WPGLHHPARERRALRTGTCGPVGRGVCNAAPALAAERALREVRPRRLHQDRAGTTRLPGRRPARAAGAVTGAGGGGDSGGPGVIGATWPIVVTLAHAGGSG